MGNLLSSEIPSQVQNIESYFDDVSGVIFYKSLWRTRFLKTVHSKIPKNNVTKNERDSLLDYSHISDVVTKVFVFNSLEVDMVLPFKVKLNQMKDRLNSLPSCSTYQVILLTHRAAMMVRQYFYLSLYDRLNTRPYLTFQEKLWVFFQILQILKSIHSARIIHGDLKLENFMITNWNWIVLTDFASAYKPALLDIDNPVPNFNYFFDTSRRRTCYLAPERFTKMQAVATYRSNFFKQDNGENASPQNLPLNMPHQHGIGKNFQIPTTSVDYHMWTNEHTYEMDLFSMGCVLFELFTDGKVPFDLTQLLQYKNGTEHYQSLCDRIDANVENEYIADVIKNSLNLDPRERKSAEQHLENLRNKLFPDFFYFFLYTYFKKWAKFTSSQADKWINEFNNDRKILDSELSSISEILNKDEVKSTCYLVTLSIITSNLRRLKIVKNIILGLDLLVIWSQNLHSTIILDRVLPYILYFVNNSSDKVRSHIPEVLWLTLKNVKTVDRMEDLTIFNDYIFPKVHILAQDSSLWVRIKTAKFVSKIVSISFKYCDMLQEFLYNSLKTNASKIAIPNATTSTMVVVTPANENNENEANQLLSKNMLSTHEYFNNSLIETTDNISYLKILETVIQNVKDLVITLLRDTCSTVTIAILKYSFIEIYTYIRQRTISVNIHLHDTVLSHAITLLNNKHNPKLRETFFSIVPEINSILGAGFEHIVTPLLEQGLSDLNEWTLYTSIRSITKVFSQELFSINTSHRPIIEGVISLLSHPNPQIRIATVTAISTIYLNNKHLECIISLSDLMENYLNSPSWTFTYLFQNPKKLFHYCKCPIEKSLYNILIKSKSTPLFVNFIQIKILPILFQPNFEEKLNELIEIQANSISRLFNLLKSTFLNDSSGFKRLIDFSDHILRLNKIMSEWEMVSNFSYYELMGKDSAIGNSGIIQLKCNNPTKIMNLDSEQNNNNNTINIQTVNLLAIDQTKFLFKVTENVLDYSLKIRLLQQQQHQQQDDDNDDDTLCNHHLFNNEYINTCESSVKGDMNDEQKFISFNKTCFEAVKLIEKDFIRQDFNRSSSHLKTELNKVTVTASQNETINAKSDPLIEAEYEVIKGIRDCKLLITSKKHTGCVFNVVRMNSQDLYASSGNDGVVNIFKFKYDENEMQFPQNVTAYKRMAGRINSLIFIENPTYSETLLASSCVESSDIHIFDVDGQLRHKYASSPLDDGHFVDLELLNISYYPFLLGATVKGTTYGFDLRQKLSHPALKYKQRLENASSHALSSIIVDPFGCWFGSGDLDGNILIWDVRFGSSPIFNFPSNKPITILKNHPTNSNLISAGYHHSINPLKIFNVKTGFIEDVYETQHRISTFSLDLTACGENAYAVFGGSDLRLRAWNICQLKGHSIIADYTPEYKSSSLINYYEFIRVYSQETYYSTLENITKSHSPKIGSTKSSYSTLNSHTMSIDIQNMYDKKKLMVTGSADGSILFYTLDFF